VFDVIRSPEIKEEKEEEIDEDKEKRR